MMDRGNGIEGGLSFFSLQPPNLICILSHPSLSLLFSLSFLILSHLEMNERREKGNDK